MLWPAMCLPFCLSGVYVLPMFSWHLNKLESEPLTTGFTLYYPGPSLPCD